MKAMASKITNKGMFSAANKAFNLAFKSPDVFGEIFNENIRKRLILFPVSYELTVDQYRAVGKAAKAIDESEAFITETEGYKKALHFETWDHWKVDLLGVPVHSVRKLTLSKS